MEALDALQGWDRDLETVRKIVPLLIVVPTPERLGEIRDILEGEDLSL
jgi:hypothetical protein